jgi:hypothetical protein
MLKTSGLPEPESTIAELARLQDLYLQCRAVFPTMTQELVGHRHFITAAYYMRRGYAATIELNDPISAEFIERNRRLGKWINENAIIRLWGVMEHHGYLTKIDHTLKGWKEVDLMRRMRNAFTKTSLNYKPTRPQNVRLRAEVIRHFRLNEKEFADGEIPTPIDTVVEPIFNACRAYITAKSAAHNHRLNQTGDKPLCLAPLD